MITQEAFLKLNLDKKRFIILNITKNLSNWNDIFKDLYDILYKFWNEELYNTIFSVIEKAIYDINNWININFLTEIIINYNLK